MCHISYRETIAGSSQRKPGRARGRGWEGKTKRRGAGGKAEACLYQVVFPLRSVGQEQLVAHSHTHTYSDQKKPQKHTNTAQRELFVEVKASVLSPKT